MIITFITIIYPILFVGLPEEMRQLVFNILYLILFSLKIYLNLFELTRFVKLH